MQTPIIWGGGGTFLAYSIAVVTAVFLIGAVIDILRQKLIDHKILSLIDRIEMVSKNFFGSL